jgi:beta-mannosidase
VSTLRHTDAVTVRELHDGWTVRASGGPIPDHLVDRVIPATVPGSVHLDLMRAGLIPDPYLGRNEAEVAWVGNVDWRYELDFDWSGAEPHVDLVAAGLDTVATVAVNGTVLARTANMHRTFRLPVQDVLLAGQNRLTITFAAPLPAAERASRALGPRPHVNAHPYNALRKMACNFGWDWGPDLATAGIWRPLRLEGRHGARIAAVRPLVAVDGTTGRLSAHIELDRADSRPLAVQVAVGGKLGTAVVDGASAVVAVDVPDVRLWWPAGEGAQELYDVRVTLGDGLDDWAGRVGFRTVELDTSADEHGTRYTLSVNGRALFLRGVNWIPDDCFPASVTRERYAERLRQARDMNVNAVRVWGGGIYESDDFYDACDELGLLVLQDFLFACAAYAEEEPLRGEVLAEAREAVTRLSPHPSLAVWNGGNENIWGYEDWGWQQPLAGRSWGGGYYTELLPAVVAELDPTRPYTPGSPFSFSPGRHPNDPAHGTVHIWDVWNERDYTAYREYRPRFVAEFGFQGPPSWATLIRAVPEPERQPDSATMLLHQKADDGNGKLARGLAGHLPPPGSVEDWHWATSLNQARAVAFGVEHLRSLAPVCSGALVWQLNDCWPVTSWAAIDGDGRRKPLWYALRRAFAPRLLTVQPRDGGLALVAVNDGTGTWRDTVAVTRRELDGSVVARAVLQVVAAPRTAVTVPLPAEVALASDPRGELLLAEAAELRAWWHFVADVSADLEPAVLDTEVSAIDGGYAVTVTARTLIRDLALLADRVAPDAQVDDMLLTLLPGETVTFTVRTGMRLAPELLTGPSVLRCVNQLLTARTRRSTD